MKVKLKRRLVSAVSQGTFIGISVCLATIGLKGFLLPNGFIDGGIMGISLLATHFGTIPLYAWIIALNLPFVWLGFRQVGWPFSLRSILAIFALALCIASFKISVITHDKLLASVFGGLFLGCGVGMAIRGGAVIDGTEILALYLNRKWGLTIGDIVLGLNLLIFAVAAWILNVESALYSILTYFSASKMVDFIVQGIEEYIGVTIISQFKTPEIKHMLIEKLGRGVTVYKGQSGYGSKGHQKELDILFSVITRLELIRLKSELATIDRKAFVIEQPVRDIQGGVVKRRAHHHI